MIAFDSGELLTISLVLFTAVLHASWNALVKASGDPLVNIAIVSATGGIAAIPILLYFPFPGPQTWPWLALSACVHFAYQLSLVRMYQLGDLSQVYPIARGLAPLGVAVLAAIGADESLAPLQIGGLMIASIAIVALSRLGDGGSSSRKAVGMALLTAALIGLYTFSDARGVRSVDDPMRFIGWSFFLGSAPIVLTSIWIRGWSIWARIRASGLTALGGGIMATIGYAIVLWAMNRTTMASVASLRESSVLFAALLGTRLLGEPFGRRRVFAALALVFGLSLVQLAK